MDHDMEEVAGLFNMALSDSSDGEAGGSGTATEAPRDRKGQTEDEFQAVKRTYRPKLDDDCNGIKIWKKSTVHVLPLVGQRKLTKQEGQELLHAVEELYFYGSFEEAVAFIGRVFEGEGGGTQGLLDADVREVLRTYESKCVTKMRVKTP